MIFHLRALACVGFEWSRDAIHRLTLYSNILHWLTIFSSSYYCWSIILFLEQYSLMQLRLIFSCDEDDNDSSGLLVSNKGKENHFQVQMVSTLYYFCQLFACFTQPQVKVSLVFSANNWATTNYPTDPPHILLMDSLSTAALMIFGR